MDCQLCASWFIFEALDVQVLNSKYNSKVSLVLGTSDNTNRAIKQAVKKYSTSNVDIVVFNQTEYPREVWPVTPKIGEDGGYLTNNGDLFAAFSFSGKLDEFLAQRKEYLFIASCDNLGATVDLSILHHLSDSYVPSAFCFLSVEFSFRCSCFESRSTHSDFFFFLSRDFQIC